MPSTIQNNHLLNILIFILMFTIVNYIIIFLMIKIHKNNTNQQSHNLIILKVLYLEMQYEHHIKYYQIIMKLNHLNYQLFLEHMQYVNMNYLILIFLLLSNYNHFNILFINIMLNFIIIIFQHQLNNQWYNFLTQDY